MFQSLKKSAPSLKDYTKTSLSLENEVYGLYIRYHQFWKSWVVRKVSGFIWEEDTVLLTLLLWYKLSINNTSYFMLMFKCNTNK